MAIAEPIVIIHAGKGAELTGNRNDIWSHSWSTNGYLTKDNIKVGRYTIQPEYWETAVPSATDMTIGVYAHEMGHGFWNLPDLYDTSINASSEGIGEYDLMASGSWNGAYGDTPAWPSAWTRIQMGFATPTTIEASETGRSIPQPYDAPGAQSVLKLTSPSLHDPNEYYLIENREKVFGHYDYHLPGNGLFIWHIDEDMASNDNPCAVSPQSSCSDYFHNLVALMQADGHHDLEGGGNRGDAGDPYPGTSGNHTFSNTSTPDSGSWYASGDSGLRVTNISTAGATMTADITLPKANSAPVANNDAYSLSEDSPLSVAVPGILSNDTDDDLDPLTAVKVTSPSHGSLAFNTNGSFTYTPYANWNGADSFTYKVSDGKLYSNTATVTFTILPVNDKPVATNDTFVTYEDTSRTFDAPGVLINDSDVDGNPLTAIQLSDPANGAVTFSADGSFTYLGNPNFNGTNSFTYKVNDGTEDSSAATVTIQVNPVNDPPQAGADSYITDEDTPLTVGAPGVLANDHDIDGDPLTPIKVSNPLHGSLVFHADGSFVYTPSKNWNGSDSFAYYLNDGSGNSGVVKVDLTVTPVNDAPVVTSSSYTTNEDTPITSAAPGLLANAVDVDNDTLSVTKLSAPLNGSLVLNADGSFVYTPDANYHGGDSFTYSANDGTVDSDIASVTITVKSVNDVPVAIDDSLVTDEDSTLTVSAPGVLQNDTDVDGNSITAVKVTNPAHGSLTLNSNGSLTYKPAANYFGADSFTYKAKDGVGPSNIATVTVTVNPVNDAPFAVNDKFNVDQDLVLTVAAPGLLANDTDLDGDALSALLTVNPTHGNINLNPDGSFIYTPDSGFYGTDGFSYAANDSVAGSAAALVTITVDRLNLPPVAEGESYSVDEDHRLTVSAPGILANDNDPEGRRVKIILVSKPANGTLSFRANGWFSYKPYHNWNGEDNFTYRVTDGVKVSDVITTAITVNPVDDAPIVVSDLYTTEMNQTLTVTAPGVMVNDREFDGDALNVTIMRPPLYGTIVFKNDGSFSYVPNVNFHGIDYFKYRILESVYNSNTTTVTIKVKRPVYTFSGFFGPIVNKPDINVMNAGENVRIPFGLGGDRGLVISPTETPSSVKVSCSSSAAYIDVETTTDPTGLSYDSGADQYTYVWETDPTWSGTCRKFILRLNDRSTRTLLFKFN